MTTRPAKSAGKVEYGATTFPIAKTKRHRRMYYLTVFFTEVQKGGRERKRVKWHNSYLTWLDQDKIPAKALASIQSRIVDGIDSGRLYDDVKAGLDQAIAATLNRVNNAYAVQPVLDRHLALILGSPAIQAGRIAQLSEDQPAFVKGIAGVGAVASAVNMAAAWGKIPVSAIIGGATTSALSGPTAAAAISFGGGYLIGGAVDRYIVSPLTNWLTDGQSPTLGDAIYDASHPDEDSTPASDSSDAAGSDSSTDGAGASGEGDTNGSDSDEEDDSDTSTSSDTSGEDEDDDASSGNSTGDAGDSGTTIPPDLDMGSSGLGALALYMVTKLGGSEARQQLSAIDILAGGDLGVQRPKDNLEAWLQIDQILGALYFKSLTRSLETHRNRYGQREIMTFYSDINVSRLPNYGLVNPMPLDAIFIGETARTRGFLR